jgi:pimeloyl-ACP methyl ester carboxylesterase
VPLTPSTAKGTTCETLKPQVTVKIVALQHEQSGRRTSASTFSTRSRFRVLAEQETVDLLAHSMGGPVAQQVAFDRPELVRRLVLVGTGPRGGEGIGETPPETRALFFKTYAHQEEMWLPILFAPSETSQAAGRAFLTRIMARKDRDAGVSTGTVQGLGAGVQ